MEANGALFASCTTTVGALAGFDLGSAGADWPCQATEEEVGSEGGCEEAACCCAYCRGTGLMSRSRCGGSSFLFCSPHTFVSPAGAQNAMKCRPNITI